jgi:hypothetical protein
MHQQQVSCTGMWVSGARQAQQPACLASVYCKHAETAGVCSCATIGNMDCWPFFCADAFVHNTASSVIVVCCASCAADMLKLDKTGGMAILFLLL